MDFPCFPCYLPPAPNPAGFRPHRRDSLGSLASPGSDVCSSTYSDLEDSAPLRDAELRRWLLLAAWDRDYPELEEELRREVRPNQKRKKVRVKRWQRKF